VRLAFIAKDANEFGDEPQTEGRENLAVVQQAIERITIPNDSLSQFQKRQLLASSLTTNRGQGVL
jgi:hypothetical protein